MTTAKDLSAEISAESYFDINMYLFFFARDINMYLHWHGTWFECIKVLAESYFDFHEYYKFLVNHRKSICSEHNIILGPKKHSFEFSLWIDQQK